jgi:hypothetical protein
MDIVRVEVFDAIEGHQTHRLTVKDIALLLGYPDIERPVRTVRGMQIIDGGLTGGQPKPSNTNVKSKLRHHLKLVANLAGNEADLVSDNALAS